MRAEPDALQAELASQTGDVDVVLDYLSGPPTEAVLAAIARSHQAGTPVRHVIAGTEAGPATMTAGASSSRSITLRENGRPVQR